MIILTDKQISAAVKVEKWYRSVTSKQLFVINGFAGTGKSTIVSYIIDKLGLAKEEVCFATFTGKASLVLNMKGLNASTIHRMIYEPYDKESEIRDGLGNVVRKIITTGFKKVSCLPPMVKLIVLDEWSMIPDELLKDILSYGVMVVALGDPGQLPPVNGVNSFIGQEDIFLDEVHRQAEDNPIIYLSMLARTNKYIDYGCYGDKVVVLPKDEITLDVLSMADQVLCGKNATRQYWNEKIRFSKGFLGDLPVKGDKVICTRNNWDKYMDKIPLINGLTGFVMNDITDISQRDLTFRMDFRPDFSDNHFEGIVVDLCDFNTERNRTNANSIVVNDGSKMIVDSNGVPINRFDFGDVITVHKSQGSQWDKVALIAEMLKPSEFKKWLYTGITRASNKLVIYK